MRAEVDSLSELTSRDQRPSPWCCTRCSSKQANISMTFENPTSQEVISPKPFLDSFRLAANLYKTFINSNANRGRLL
jgi:hypothetical protein